MDIRQTLLTPVYQSKAVAQEVANYACTDPAFFDELVQCFLSDEYRLAQRAAYSLGMAAEQQPAWMQPHLATLVAQLKRTDIHDAVIRNAVRILQEANIPEALHGELMDVCFTFIQNRATPIAIKAFSLTVLYNLSKIYPEIANELRVIIEENMDYETPAFQSRGKKILAKLKGRPPGKRL